jgi:hypothetical protein
MGFPEGLKICHTKRFFLEFTLGLFQKSLFDMRNIYKCFNKIYFWHIFYATMGLTWFFAAYNCLRLYLRYAI